jgi:hypothetical protein
MRSTPVVLLVFVLVLNRWLETVTGWSEAILLPLAAVAGTVLLDVLVLPRGSRLTPRGWALNLCLAAVIGGLLGFLQRS